MPSGDRNETTETGGAMVDAHCHIDLYPDPENVVAESEAGRIYTIAVTNAPSVFHYTASITANHKYIRAAAGLHPELVQSHGRELNLLWPLLEQTRYVGEVGLDYSTTDQSVRRAQRDVFTQILERCSGYRNKILTLHSRRAAGDVIAAVGNDYPGKVILHWFSGSGAELERAAGFGMYFSVNTSMVNSKKGQALIAKMPADRVITESDGPFINVVNEPARPHHMERVIERLGLLWGLSFEESRARVISNFRGLIADES